MTIVDERKKNTITFANADIGDIFILGGCVFIKISKHNAFDLTRKHQSTLVSSAPITIVKTTLTIED